jgi:polar amino acid transport system ATP-binding protein
LSAMPESHFPLEQALPDPQRSTDQSVAPVAMFRDVSKAYGAHMVLDHLDLQVAPGERVSIIGPSGSGKTTILRATVGLERPDSGEILVAGRSVWHMNRRGKQVPANERHLRSARLGTGMVFQQFNLFPHLTAIENVAAALIHVQGKGRDAARARAGELLCDVGLEAHGQKRPGQLSGGQQQRVAIARALATEPKVLVLDEITSALDPEKVGEVLAVIRDVAAVSQIAMLNVTHELSFAEHISDRVIMFDQGRIVEQGPPSAILHDPKEQRTKQFLGALLDRG